MKSTDKFVLVLVASLALLLAGCGGGSSTTAPPVDPGPTAAEQAIMDAKADLTTAQAGVSGAMTDAERRDAYRAVQQAADDLIMVLQANDGSPADIVMATRTSENAKNMADNLAMKVADAEAAAEKAMMAMAAKLYNAIGMTPLANNAANTPTLDATSGALSVHNGTITGTSAVTLDKDKMAMVAPLHGWKGSMHTKTVADGTANDGTYTAQMYANMEEPEQGAMFNDATNGGYTLNADDLIADVTIVTGYAGLVASPSFDQSAGTKSFELPTNNVAVMIPGSFNGVAGTYGCTPTDANSTCSATVAASGFTLAGGTWTFKPTDPEARLMGTPDAVYAVYGWWLHENDDGATVSAFANTRGTVTAAAGVTALQGTATYKGGAAGKYTIRAGAVNDAGHFTADAELMADFSDNTVTGTIDNFMGSDGMSRDWSVALGASNVTDAGVIADHPTDTADTGPQETTWTMGGSAGNAGGQWSGTLYDNNAGGVPKVGTGTFHSTYGNIGRMVGAFGVNLEN